MSTPDLQETNLSGAYHSLDGALSASKSMRKFEGKPLLVHNLKAEEMKQPL